MAAESFVSPAMSGSSADLVFLSYARSDRAAVEPIAAALRARGASVWYDVSSAAGGGAYVESMQRALRRSSMMLVFVSASAAKSSWVAEEIRAYRSLMAREGGHKLLAIHLDKTRAPIALAGAEAIDAHGQPAGDVADQIARAVGAAPLISDSTPSAPVAPEATDAPAAAVAATAAPVAAAVAAGSKVFVSYDRSDRAQVEPLVTALRGQGVQVWDDGGVAQGSSGWIESSSAALHDARTLLIAVSSASAASPWVADEVRAFQNHKVRDPGRSIIAVHLDQTAAPTSLNGASSVDAQSLTPEDAARLIAAALPASAAVATGAAAAAEVAPVAGDAGIAEPAPAAEEAEPVEAEPLDEAAVATEALAADQAPVVEAAAIEEALIVEAPAPVTAPAAEEAAPTATAAEEAAPVTAAAAAEAAPVEEADLAADYPTPAPVESVTPPEAAPAAEAVTPSPEAEAAALPVTTPALRSLPADEGVTIPAVTAVAQPAPVAPAATATASGAFPDELAPWQKVAGPAALVIVAIIITALIAWAHAGFPL